MIKKRDKRLSSFVARHSLVRRARTHASALVLSRLVSKPFLTFLFGVFIFIPGHAGDVLEGLRRNNEAIRQIENEDLASAEHSLLQSMAEDPNNPIPHLNLGLVYEVGKNYDKAIKEAELVLRYQNLPPELQFVAHFNAGNAAAQKQDIERALKHYQAALDLGLDDPPPQDVKHNIELLFKGGGGQGKGQNQSKNDKNKEGDGEGDQNQQNQPPKDPGQNPQNQQPDKPKFKSENLTKEDVRKILEELKTQEKRIRALEYGGKSKEKPPEKDW